VCLRKTNGVQKHRAFLDLDNLMAKAVGRPRMPGITPGALELAASFLATNTHTNMVGSGGRQKGILASR
jgi:hypothetical protein